MSMLSQLSPIYKIAILAGCRIQVSVKDKWEDCFNYSSLKHGRKLRIHPEDEDSFRNVKELVKKNYVSIKFLEYDYLIPKNSLEKGSLILLEYGFGGIFVEIFEDNNLIEINREIAQKRINSESKHVFRGINFEEFYDL